MCHVMAPIIMVMVVILLGERWGAAQCEVGGCAHFAPAAGCHARWALGAMRSRALSHCVNSAFELYCLCTRVLIVIIKTFC